jgi:hypothetical protein
MGGDRLATARERRAKRCSGDKLCEKPRKPVACILENNERTRLFLQKLALAENVTPRCSLVLSPPARAQRAPGESYSDVILRACEGADLGAS